MPMNSNGQLLTVTCYAHLNTIECYFNSIQIVLTISIVTTLHIAQLCLAVRSSVGRGVI